MKAKQRRKTRKHHEMRTENRLPAERRKKKYMNKMKDENDEMRFSLGFLTCYV